MGLKYWNRLLEKSSKMNRIKIVLFFKSKIKNKYFFFKNKKLKWIAQKNSIA